MYKSYKPLTKSYKLKSSQKTKVIVTGPKYRIFRSLKTSKNDFFEKTKKSKNLIFQFFANILLLIVDLVGETRKGWYL